MSHDRPSRRSLSHTGQGRPYIGTGRKKPGWSARRRRNSVLGLERLEDRTLLATFTDSSPTLALALAANDAVSIVANTSTYTLKLASPGTWSGTNDGHVSGNGTDTLTVQESAFTQVNLIDAGAGTSVTFDDSGSNSYASGFNVALTNAAAGSITFNGVTSFTGSNTLSATGGAIDFHAGSVTSAGNVSLTATSGSILETAAGAGADVTGATVTLTTTGSRKDIGTPPPVDGMSTPIKVNSSLLNATTDNGFIVVANTTANMALGSLNAGAALIELTAVGAITDGRSGSGPANLIAADGAVLTTTGSNSAIGTSALPVRTAIGALSATTNDGGVYISDSNGPGLIIGSILAQQGGSAAVLNKNNQVVVYDSNNNQIVGTDNVSVTATGLILLFNAATVNTTVSAPNAVTITSTGGKIVEGQAGSVNVLARSVTLTANGAIGASGGSIGLMASAFSASTTNGGIFLTDGIPGTAASVVAGGAGNDVSVTGFGATLGIGTITAPGTVTVGESHGALVSGTNMNVTGQTVNLTGKSGIGSSSSPFAVTASNLSATEDDPGDGIFVTDTSAASSVSATTHAGDVTMAYSGGSLDFTASTGLLSATGGAIVSFDNTGGNVELGVVTAASISASGAITAAGNVNVTGGTVTLTAGTGIGASGSPIETNVTTLEATTTSGDIFIDQGANPLTVSATSGGYSNTTAMTGSDIDVQATGNLTVGTISGLGTVTVSTGGALSATDGGAFSLTANTLDLTAANGIGTSSAVVMTSVHTLSANGGAGGGLFLSNNQTLSVTSASAGGGAVSITTLGDLDVGSVTAAGQAVTLSAGGALIDPSGPALNVTAQSATLTGSSIGGPGDPLETRASSITATATGGALYLSDLGTGSLTLTASATGVGSDIDFNGAGSIVLRTVTAQGNTVTLTADGSITNGNAPADPPKVNITAQTLDIVAHGGIGTSGDHLEVLVGQVATADGGGPGVFMDNAGPLEIKETALEATGTGTLTFDAASITIEDMGGTTVDVAPGRSLLLETQTGPIVFLNPADTIATSDGGTITVAAGTIAGSGGVAVIGNLTTAGGNILVTADGDITIGRLDAGTGNVTVQSANGLIIKGNGPSQLNIIAGSATLSGNAPTARQLQLNEENAIAGATAASAEAAAEQTLADAFRSKLPVEIAEVAGDAAATLAEGITFAIELGVAIALTGGPDVSAAGALADIGAAQTTLTAAEKVAPTAPSAGQLLKVEAQLIPELTDLQELPKTLTAVPKVPPVGGTLLTAEATVDATLIADEVAQTSETAAADIAGPADAVPLTGDAGTDSIWATLNSVWDGLAAAYNDASTALQDIEVEAAEAYANAIAGFTSLSADIADLGGAAAALIAELAADGIAEAAAENALLQSETSAVVSTQAIAANDQRNAIGSPTDPLGIQVSGAVNVTAGPADSFLQVTGNTALGQIQATGGVTLISTGAITNGEPPGTPNVVATGLTIEAANGIGTASNPLLTRVGTLNATNTGSGDIDISNTAGTPAALDITGLSNTGGGNVVISNEGNAAAGQGITVSGPIGTTGAGTVTINSGSPLTIAANVTSAGAITLSAAETPASGDDLTVDPGVTIQSTTSSVTLQAGDNITVPTGSTIEAATTITITADHNTADTAGANVVVEGTLIAPSALIDVDPNDTNNDTLTITPSVSTPIAVNGGLGSDTLNFNADGLPVTISGNRITAAGRAPVTFSSVEAMNITNAAGGGSITLDAVAGMDDDMVLTGTGSGAGTFTLNGGTPISFSGVNTFAYDGGNRNEAITVAPFATPLLQWGVAVTINGGTGHATLTYDNVAGVSDNITIQPSAPAAGQLIDNNAATGTSIAAITYVQTNNFVINGSSRGSTGDTDSLFINGTDPANPGTSGNDDALANFQAAGDVARPMVRLYDAGAGAVGGRSPSAAELADTAGAAANDLFNLQSFTNFSTIHIGLLGGNDVLDLLGGAVGGALAIDDTCGTGDDTLIVDSTNGPVLGAINDDGGPGTNSMILTGGTATSDTYTPGAQLGTGTNTLVFTGGTESVSFQNLATIFDQVAGPLVVNGNNASNAITYQEGNDTTNTPNPAWGQVSVDNLEPINFSNKNTLTVNGLAGTDTFSINNPNTPTGLGRIAVSGSGSTGSDALVVTGVAPTVGVDMAARTITGAAGAATIAYGTIGALIVHAGPSTGLAVSNSSAFIYAPGSTADAGTVQTGTLPISFTGLDASKTLSLTGSGTGASLVVNDPTANDALSVAANTGNVTLPGRATIITASIPNLTLNGLSGIDTFNVTGPLSYNSITLAGGGAGVANLNGGGSDVTANLGGTIASVTGGGLGTVSLPGIGTLNLNAGAGNITLAGTSGPDAFTVTPTGANTATAQLGSLSPVVNTTNTGSLTVNGASGGNSLAVNGTTGADTIAVDGSSVAVNSFKVVNYINIAALQVNGLAGGDTFSVTPSLTVSISIVGGSLVGNRLNVLTNPGDTVTADPGPTSDQGAFVVNNDQPISFVHIQSVSVSGGGTPVINGTNGTNGNGAIDIVARDSSYASGLDGIQDFTVSINGGPNVLFVNTPSLEVNTLVGSGQVVLQAPAPNLAAWNVDVAVAGGIPSISNQLVVIAPGVDQATYTPASFNSGTLGVAGSNGTVANVSFTNIESFLYDGQAGGDTFTLVGTTGANAFTLTPGAANDAGTLSMDSTLPVTFQNLGTSGQVVVNGNGGADSLVDNGTAANDTFSINKSALGGQVNLNARVPVLTQNIPTLSLEGLAGDDSFTLVPTISTSPYTTLDLDGGATASATGNRATLTAAASSPLGISGQTVAQGGRTVVGTGLQDIDLDGAGNDLTYNGVAGVAEAIDVTASPTAGQGQVSVRGVALWSFTAVPFVYVNGNASDNDTLTFTGTSNSDVYQINLNAAGTDAAPVLALQDTNRSTLLTLGNYSGFSTLNVSGLDGADTFNVYTGPTVSRDLYLNGGTSNGKQKLTDLLNVFYVKPKPTIVQSAATQDPSSGLVSLNYGTSSDTITYDGIENVTISQAAAGSPASSSPTPAAPAPIAPTLTPVAANVAGTLSTDSTLPVTYQDPGTSGQVVVNGNGGADSPVYSGTAASDSFSIHSRRRPGQSGRPRAGADSRHPAPVPGRTVGRRHLHPRADHLDQPVHDSGPGRRGHGHSGHPDLGHIIRPGHQRPDDHAGR